MITASFAPEAKSRADDRPSALPPFAIVASDGHTYTSNIFLSGAPTLFLFLAAGCPRLAQGIADMNRLCLVAGESLRVVAITDQDITTARKLARKYDARFPILAERVGPTISALGGRSSLDIAVFLPRARRLRRWDGYDQSVVEEISEELRQSGLGGFPAYLAACSPIRQQGCRFRVQG